MPRPASPFFPTLVCHLIICFVRFSRMLCKSDCWNHRRKKYVFDDVKFRDSKKFYGARKFRSYQEVVSIYRPLGYGPSTLPLLHPALMLLSSKDFCPLNLSIVRLFLLLFKTDALNYLRSDFALWSDFVKSRKFYWVILTVNLGIGSF